MLDLVRGDLRLARVPPPTVASFVHRGRGTSISTLAINCRIGQRSKGSWLRRLTKVVGTRL